MGEVTHLEPAPPPAPVAASDTATIIAVIERAASNPAVDLEKLERLIGLQERVVSRQAAQAYAEALAQMQPELPVIGERGRIEHSGKLQSRYALWEDINEAIRPVMARHGFALSFRTAREDGMIVVTGVLSHRGGHSERTTMHLPLDNSGSKNSVQAVGSSTSYGKRYTAAALLNLTSRGEDDDGKAGGGGFITPEQVAQIEAKIREVGADLPRFLSYLGAPDVPSIPAGKFRDALASLARRAAAAANGAKRGGR